MITIRPMIVGEADTAIDLIVSVAQPMFAPAETAAAFRTRFEAQGYFDDVHDFTTAYGPPGGTFLVALDKGVMIGTGALRRRDDQTAELRRLWLNDTYHGRGIGYGLTQELMAFAVHTGYEVIELTTDDVQTRAIAFYQQVGFVTVGVDGDNVHMRLTLSPLRR